MHSIDPLVPHLTRVIKPLRWAIPLTLSALGFSFVIWEAILLDGYPVLSIQVLLGFGVLGLIGPLLMFLTLDWALRAALSNERAEAAQEQQYRHLLALNTLGEAVNQSLDLNTVLQHALDRVLDVLHLESGEIRLIENDYLVLKSARGVSSAFQDAESVVRLGECVCGQCAERGEVIGVEDLKTADAFAHTNCAREQFQATLTVPVRTADHIVGVIHVASRDPRTFDDAERTLLAAIGQQVGVAIEKARLHEQLKAMNQQLEARVVHRTRALYAAKEELADKADALRQVLVEERRVEERTRARIAHDLHDGIQQVIIGALFEVQAAREALILNPAGAPLHLEQAQGLLRRIESEMRDAIYSLRPVALDGQGLVSALRECVSSFERVAAVPCELRVEGTAHRFNPDAEVAAFRIVQEALNNVEAHAQAQHVRCCVCFNARDLRVEVEDDGCGFDMSEVTQQARTHLGLMGMQERAESVGGALDVWSRLGEGTRIVLNIPMSQ